MKINNKNMVDNELRKAWLLIMEASRLNMDISSYGYADVNQNSGNTYLWMEDYPACLFIPINDDTIYACYSDPENGEETETETNKWANIDNMYEWVKGIKND